LASELTVWNLKIGMRRGARLKMQMTKTRNTMPMSGGLDDIKRMHVVAIWRCEGKGVLGIRTWLGAKIWHFAFI